WSKRRAAFDEFIIGNDESRFPVGMALGVFSKSALPQREGQEFTFPVFTPVKHLRCSAFRRFSAAILRCHTQYPLPSCAARHRANRILAPRFRRSRKLSVHYGARGHMIPYDDPRSLWSATRPALARWRFVHSIFEQAASRQAVQRKFYALPGD